MSPTEEGKLSKEEVEALLQATQDEEAPEEGPEPQRRVQGYNFLQPRRFNRSELENLKDLNEQLARRAVAHASRLLRSNVSAQPVSVDQMTWENLAEEAGETAVGFVFVLEPLGYRALITVDSQFAVAALERMMGGEVERAATGTMEFTSIDARVLGALLDGFLNTLPELWNRIGEFQVARDQFVEDVQGLDLFPGHEDLLQITFLVQATIGSGQVCLSVPFEAVRELPPESQSRPELTREEDEVAAAGLRRSLERTPVTVAALLGSADIKVSRLVKAQVGDVIVLRRRVGEPVDVRLNDKIKFRGLPGVSNGALAVQLIVEEA